MEAVETYMRRSRSRDWPFNLVLPLLALVELAWLGFLAYGAIRLLR